MFIENFKNNYGINVECQENRLELRTNIVFANYDIGVSSRNKNKLKGLGDCSLG